jgi:hypothetical protein
MRRCLPEVKIQSLVEWKGIRVISIGDIGICLTRGEVVDMALEAGILQIVSNDSARPGRRLFTYMFFNPTYTNTSADWRAEAIVAVELKVNCVLETFPLFVCEQITESRIAKGNRLVGAKGLSLVQRQLVFN